MANQWARIYNNVTEKQIKVARASTIKVGTRVVNRTPVDKGILKNSWMTGIGNEAIDARTPNTSGSDSISGLIAESKELTTGKILYFTNPLPYALKMEFGGSEQEPQGMLRRSAAEWPQIVAQTAREIK